MSMAGFSNDQVIAIIKEITQTFVDLGIPQESVQVVVQEVPQFHWGVGGSTCLGVNAPSQCSETTVSPSCTGENETCE